MQGGGESPLGLDPRDDASARLPHDRHARRPDHRAAGAGGPRRRPRRSCASGSRTPPPEEPAGYDEILDGLERDVLPFVARISHPGYLAFIPGEGTWPGALGDLIASALNIDTCWWLGASGPSALELVVIDWLRQWVGYPESAAGVLVSGGSASNLTALACAREARIGADGRAARSSTCPTRRTRRWRARRGRSGSGPTRCASSRPTRPARIRADALRSAIAADVAGGRTPADRDRERRHDRDRRDRPVRRARGALPRARRSGCTSTAPTARSPA